MYETGMEYRSNIYIDYDAPRLAPLAELFVRLPIMEGNERALLNINF